MAKSKTPKTSKPPAAAGHRGRLRDKFIQFGLEKFTDEEVLELLLTIATPRRDCKPMARALMKRFGSMRKVFEATPEETAEIEGLGLKNTFGIRLIDQITKRFARDRLIQGGVITSSSQAYEYLSLSMRDLRRETFRVIYLDKQRRVLTDEDLFTGTLDKSEVHPREVIAQALKHNAKWLIFAHNHPSGDPKPSMDDLNLTRDLVVACELVGIGVLDHVIVGNNCYFSMADHNHIERFKSEAERIASVNEPGKRPEIEPEGGAAGEPEPDR